VLPEVHCHGGVLWKLRANRYQVHPSGHPEMSHKNNAFLTPFQFKTEIFCAATNLLKRGTYEGTLHFSHRTGRRDPGPVDPHRANSAPQQQRRQGTHQDLDFGQLGHLASSRGFHLTENTGDSLIALHRFSSKTCFASSNASTAERRNRV
jgi:hypothetical protein